jgi:hypothetical protein|nr:MAG TPA: hypothetical protein [Crassvirales sp.]
MGTNITGIGNANAIGFKSRVTGGIYFPPELKDALVGVWSAYGKSNDSTDRNIIKNKIKDRGGDFVISNAAFKLNSGFGKYGMDFLEWKSNSSMNFTSTKLTSTKPNLPGGWLTFRNVSGLISETKVKVSGAPREFVFIGNNNNGADDKFSVKINNGVYTIPEFTLSSASGFYINNNSGDWSNLVIEQIPSFEGAFVTDGIDDLITSTKNLQEMLGGSNEITVVSMIHLVQTPASSSEKAYTNQIRTGQNYLRNYVTDNGKTGIYGYTCKGNNVSVINNILGDKNDYTVENKSWNNLAKFSVIGYEDNGTINELDQVAWYWTIIANKVLTTDQINQVIAYFNLDRTLNPDILCNTIKQGITNENHAEFGDKLIDFSGNGRDIQLNNIGWKLDSGIGKYETDLSDTRIWTRSKEITSSPFSFSYNGLSGWILFANTELTNSTDIPSFKIQIKGLLEGQELIYRYYDSNGQSNVYSMGKDGEYTLPSDVRTAKPQTSNTSGFQVVKNEANIITITQIPSHAGALCLDGVNDFGKVTGMPIYKDYTIIADYERFYLEPITGGRASILSKSSKVGDGSFIFNLEDQNGGKACYTFGEANGNISDDITRIIRYQSKYYNTKALSIGTAEDNDFMVLGKVREVDNRYFYGAIYSLMSFPYSMSEFLIERQLKKHKLGTLYPDMVEFRPVIKSNVLLDAKPTFVIRGTSTYLNAGDYVPENSQIWVSIKMNNIADRITKFTVNGKTIDIPENAYSEVTLQYGFPFVIDKSPQKISITIEQDENYVLFNPVINSNYDNYKLTFHLREYEKLINIGDYIPKGTYIRANLYLKNDIDELVTFTFNGVNIDYAKSPVLDTAYNIRQIYNYDSPQEVNITIDEYIRYEDIVQPYPVLLRFKDENGNEVSWGGKFKVGSNITRIGSIADPESNLLNGLYSISGLSLNGKAVTSSTSIVEKQMVFRTTATWLLDNNEPKCILSPRLLRIPNSSYKILGHIPDISGHGNHGKINNSAYAEGSGVNEDGSYQFDGVDDFVTIPTIVGGKQVLMKMNWQNRTGLLYDQRKNGSSIDAFAILNVNSNNSIAYNSRNTDGETYIDGILNKNIVCPQLYKITHSITIINQLANKEEVISPTIGSDTTHKIYFSQMSLYDFMLFDNISTDDKIKELNEYVGIEAKVELPPYYWDAYGKTNLDADKATIQQRGVAVGDYDLTNNNHAYDKMSGYGGYKFAKFDNTIEWFAEDSSMVVNRNGYLITLKKVPNVAFWRFRNTTLKSLDNPLTFKVKCNKPIDVIFQVKFAKNNDVSIGYNYNIKEVTLVPNESTTIIVPSVSVSDIPEATSILFINVLFDNTSLSDNEEYTVEMLPLYPNGLVYDGVDDYSKNENIPALDDFTAIIKRKWLKNQGCPLIKGSKVYEGGNGNALLFEWDKAYNFVFYKRTDIMEGKVPENISFITPTNYNGNVITRGSGQDTNGICIAGDGNAGFANMVFYKLILYPKTIPLLQINFLKNLMERDEIIDLNNPIFIKNE